MKLIVLTILLFLNLHFCQSQDKLEISSELQETKDSHSGSISKCKTTSYQLGKEFPDPKLNLPKEFGDGKEFFPSFQCFHQFSLPEETSFMSELAGSYRLLITAKSNLILYKKSSCEAGWKNKTDNCVNILFFQLLEGKYVFRKRYIIEALSGEEVRMVADDDENLYMFTYRQEDLKKIKNPKPVARKGVACIVKIDIKKDKVVFSTNLLGDPSLNDKDEFAHIFNPLEAGTISLAYGDGKVVAFFSKLLGYDDLIRSRHQNSLFVAIDSTTGTEFIGINGYSHSFDQYVSYDPETKSFLGLEVGDAFDRAVGLSVLKIEKDKIKKKTTKVYLIPGNLGANETATFLGGVVPTLKGYLVAFSAEREAKYPYSRFLETDSTRTIDVALVRILNNLPNKESSSKNANVDPSWKGDVVNVIQNHDEVKSFGVRWITKNQDKMQTTKVRLFGLDKNTVLLAHYDENQSHGELALIDSDGKILKTKKINHSENGTFKIFFLDVDVIAPFYNQGGNVIGAAYLDSIQSNQTEE
ncbi:MAG: hypothetical protein N3A69_11325, partial [Leptospiraceae bacterium]|nr:hypothetical protein [Leptospiraceae bacterium]